MILVKIDIIKKGPNGSKIRIEDRILTVSNTCIVEKEGEYFVTCSDEPVPGAKKITVDSDSIYEDYEGEEYENDW
jgi:hypothetical protein